jgi:hypothetical protein
MVEWLGGLLFEGAVYFLAYITGHPLLWAVTLGRWRAFDAAGDDRAMLAGIAFWLLVGVIGWWSVSH